MEDYFREAELSDDLRVKPTVLGKGFTPYSSLKKIYLVTQHDKKSIGSNKIEKSANFFSTSKLCLQNQISFQNNPISECHMDKSRQCIVTQDRNYFGPGAVDQFDALVIDVRFFLNAKETLEMIPKKRQPFQRYVFHTHEVRRIQVSKQLLLCK